MVILTPEQRKLIEQHGFEGPEDAYGTRLHRKMLNDARKSRGDGRTLRIAVIVLTLADGRQRVVTYDCEYGDNEGSAVVAAMLADAEVNNLLKPGETLELKVIEITGFVHDILSAIQKAA